jgi:hypothetical protein
MGLVWCWWCRNNRALSLVLYQVLFRFQELLLLYKIHNCFTLHFIKIRTAYEFEVRRMFTANNSWHKNCTQSMVYYSEYGVSVLNVPVLLQFHHNITVLLKTVYQASAKDFHFSKTSIPSVAQSASYSMGTGFISWGQSGPGCDLHHSPPLRNEIKNEWTYTSTPPPICLHGDPYPCAGRI